MEHYTHWVFDLDGTLTVHQHDFDAMRRALGIPAGRLILEYLDELDEREAAPLRARLDAMEAELTDAAVAAAGAVELLDGLARRGVALGILTRNTRANAIATLRAAGLAQHFAESAVIGRDEAAPKPSPQGILHLLGQWRASPAGCVMVGDFRLDLEAGRNAGVATAHVDAADAGRWPALTDHYFGSLAELAAALDDVA
ncbi:MAG: HAD family hydrolase [Gammaproteobacteria bacterium]